MTINILTNISVLYSVLCKVSVFLVHYRNCILRIHDVGTERQNDLLTKIRAQLC